MNGSTNRALIGAAAVFTVALFLFGSALLRAFSTDASLLPPPARTPTVTDDSAGDAEVLSADALRLAVENDPFSPTRQAPLERYRLPGDVEPEPEPPPPEPPPPPPFQLTGTVITERASMALISVGDVPPRMMSVGESLMGYRLSNVTAQSATMVNEEHELHLQMPTPSRQVAAVPQPPRRGQTSPQQSRDQAARQRVMMQQIIERARAAGATPQMLEAIMRMVNDRGMDAIENMEIGPNGFTIRGNSGNTTFRFGPQTESTRPIIRPRPDTTMHRRPQP